MRPAEPVRPVRRPPSRRAAPLVLPTGSAHLRLTGRGRLCVVVAAAVLAVAVLSFSAGWVSGPTGAARRPGNVATASVVAGSGESLWSIARAAAPGRDPRITVEQLLRLNHLADVTIVAGQRLIVPGPVDTPG